MGSAHMELPRASRAGVAALNSSRAHARVSVEIAAPHAGPSARESRAGFSAPATEGTVFAFQ